VTSDKAMERVSKLREVTVERGATEHEAATARALAAQLSARFGLDLPAVLAAPVALRPQVARYASSARTDRRSSRSLRFVAFG
jgi:hypothetical protein